MKTLSNTSKATAAYISTCMSQQMPILRSSLLFSFQTLARVRQVRIYMQIFCSSTNIQLIVFAEITGDLCENHHIYAIIICLFLALCVAMVLATSGVLLGKETLIRMASKPYNCIYIDLDVHVHAVYVLIRTRLTHSTVIKLSQELMEPASCSSFSISGLVNLLCKDSANTPIV